MAKLAVKVTVIESERGWGSKVDDHMVCLSTEDANEFITRFNSKNNFPTVPDWYMYAESEIEPIDLTDAQYTLLESSEEKRMWLSSLNRILG